MVSKMSPGTLAVADFPEEEAAPPEEDLVRRAGAGDEDAMAELVTRYQQRAYAIAFHLSGRNPDLAEELTQEAFLKAFRSLGSFDGRSSFYTWFYRIVVNTCIDEKRKQRRWSRLFTLWRPPRGKDGTPRQETLEDQADPAPDTDPYAMASAGELGLRTEKALAKLPEKQQLAFRLKVFQEMSIAEIARIMGTAEGTVKSHLFRATRHLRQALKDWREP